MNCRRFQNQVYEYVDGTISALQRAAAERHLARCGACRQAVHREQQLAHVLSARLRHDAESLTLRPGLWREVQSAIAADGITPPPWASIVGFWRPFAWPFATVVSLLLMVGMRVFHPFSGARVHEMDATRSHGRDDQSAVSVQVSYSVPVRIFRQDGNVVIDTIASQTVVADETLWNASHAAVHEN